MPPPKQPHVVVRGSIEHALLASASLDTPRTGRRLLVIAIHQGLKLYDDPTVATALRRLKASGLLSAPYKRPARLYRLTEQGQQVLQVFAEHPA
ncbi:helix-turn-helix transcriptional regulator [Deinococcus alpinitundrae]|uniref:helix-turn-helix transcriptional regulator n=1 Tax=Deinococcus alpinitundrae TaxID=468913 RepID=UPI00137B194E|nr:helix-turn-helix transcriptional regulator [Deinococcus alpinitundrae]